MLLARLLIEINTTFWFVRMLAYSYSGFCDVELWSHIFSFARIPVYSALICVNYFCGIVELIRNIVPWIFLHLLFEAFCHLPSKPCILQGCLLIYTVFYVTSCHVFDCSQVRLMYGETLKFATKEIAEIWS